jgi:hypothetical protein
VHVVVVHDLRSSGTKACLVHQQCLMYPFLDSAMPDMPGACQAATGVCQLKRNQGTAAASKPTLLKMVSVGTPIQSPMQHWFDINAQKAKSNQMQLA